MHGNCDSFVVETDVHYPTDTNLLFDAVRKIISLIAGSCSETEIAGWRQSDHNILKIKHLLGVIQRLKRSTSKDKRKKEERDKLIVEAHQNYINICRGFVLKAKETISFLREKKLSKQQRIKLTVIEN